MDYLSVKEMAGVWKMTVRRIEEKCRSGRVDGAKLIGHTWMIPRDAKKPADLRFKQSRDVVAAPENDFLLKCPNILFTRIFTAPGAMEKTIRTLPPVEAELAEAFLEYFRGETESALIKAKAVAAKAKTYNAQVGAGLLISVIAIYMGDIDLWKQAEKLTATAPCGEVREKETLSFYLAAQNSALYDNSDFPEWFCRGNFEPLPYDAYPSAWFFFAKHLFIECKNYQRANTWEPQKHREAMRVLPVVCEPLISEARREGVYLVEIYLRLLAAIGYYYAGETKLCVSHIDRAIALSLPDRLYSPLAEYASALGYTLYERLQATDKKAFIEVKRLATELGKGFYNLHNSVFNKGLTKDLTLREYEVACLAAYSLTNKEIAERLHITVGAVKQILTTAMFKAGVSSRRELAKLI